MLSLLIDNIFRIIFKEYYRTKMMFLIEIFNVSISVLIYYFTSKAFGESIQTQIPFSEMSYFEFIILGDLILSVPVYYMEGVVSAFKKATVDGTLKTLRLLGLSDLKVFRSLVLPLLMANVYRSLLLLVFLAILSPAIGIIQFLLCVLGLIISILLLFPISLLSVSVFHFTGRGQGAFSFLSTILAVVSGGYFPVSMFPVWLSENVLLYNPMAWYLKVFRSFVWGVEVNGLVILPLSIIASGFSLFVFYRWIYKQALIYRKCHGEISVVLN